MHRIKKITAAIFIVMMVSRLHPLFADNGTVVPDSVLHFMGGLSAGWAAAACSTACDTGQPMLEPGAAVTGAILAGLFKETADYFGFGTVELKDFLWTLAGGCAAAGMTEVLRQTGVRKNDRSIIYTFLAIECSIPLAQPLLMRITARIYPRSLARIQ